MNPDTTNQNHFNLPPPIAEVPMPVAQGESSVGKAPMEQLQVGSPESSGNRPAPAVPMATATDNTQPPVLPLVDPATQQAIAGLPAVPVQATADEPVVDKAWILKAKRIVEQTTDNPFEQNNQLAVVKADYLQKRYGKVVKLTE